MPSDIEPAVYTERLWPSPGIWAVSISLGASLGLVPAPASLRAGVIVALIGVLVVIGALVASSTTVTVTAHSLIAGRAQVPISVVSAVETLSPEQLRQARGVSLDARAHLCLRGWLPEGARVVLSDPEDPTPYWLVSSRRPDALAAAINAGIARAR